MGLLVLIIGWLLVVTSTFVWVGHGVYQLIKTDFGFWSILFTNGGFWLLQLIIGLLLVGVGLVTKAK